MSQVLVPGNETLLWSSSFNSTHRTAVLIHGWVANAQANSNAVLVPAFLEAADMNVIVVDWCAGACTINYVTAIRNTVASGEGVAKFITWLNNATGADPSQYHIVGFSLGGQQAGVVGRNVGGHVDYITSLDPAGPGWETNEHKFNATDGNYTEVIHTNVGVSAYMEPLGQVDFYPNGGIGMPGCSTNSCDHDRSYYYLAESLRTGGFTGTKCNDFHDALIGNCTLNATSALPMGGLDAKYGAKGVFYLETNGAPPFSRY